MPRPPILFNRLESDAVAQKSVIGGALTPSGSTAYDAGYFGNAYKGVNNQYLKFNVADYWTSPDDPGTIEYWYFCPAGWTPGTGYAHLQISATAGAGEGLISIREDLPTNGIRFYLSEAGVGDDLDYTLPTADITKNGWNHIALCWDNSGIEGGANKSRVYLDGVQKGSSNTTWGHSVDWSTPDTFSVLGGHISLGNYYIRERMDNVKFYAYAKTDFSDRWAERGGLNDLVN